MTFASNNDRIMSVMSKADYKEVTPANLTGRDATTGAAEINAGTDKQTSDLGHSISAIADIISKGIQNADDMNHAISWTESSINITNRMERDIVLEQQMIEKI